MKRVLASISALGSPLAAAWDKAAATYTIANFPRQYVRPRQLFLSAAGGKFDALRIDVYPRSKRAGTISRGVMLRHVEGAFRFRGADPILGPKKSEPVNSHAGDVLSAYMLGLRQPMSYLLDGAAKDFIDAERRRLIFAARSKADDAPVKGKKSTAKQANKKRERGYRENVGLKFKIERQRVPVEKYFEEIDRKQLPVLAEKLNTLQYELQQFALRNNLIHDTQTVAYIEDRLLPTARTCINEISGHIFDYDELAADTNRDIQELRLQRATNANAIVDMKVVDDPEGHAKGEPVYDVDLDADDKTEALTAKKREYDAQIYALADRLEKNGSQTAENIQTYVSGGYSASLNGVVASLYRNISGMTFPTDSDRGRILHALEGVMAAQKNLNEQADRMVTQQSHFSIRLENAEECAALVGESPRDYQRRIENTLIKLIAPVGGSLQTIMPDSYRIADGMKPQRT